MPADEFDPVALAGALEALSAFAAEHAPPHMSPLADRVRNHFDADASEMPVVTDSYPIVERPNLQLALNAWGSAPGRSVQIIGIGSAYSGPAGVKISDIVATG